MGANHLDLHATGLPALCRACALSGLPADVLQIEWRAVACLSSPLTSSGRARFAVVTFSGRALSLPTSPPARVQELTCLPTCRVQVSTHRSRAMGQGASHSAAAEEIGEPSKIKQKLFQQIDTNASGTIEFAEFCAVMLQLGLHHASIAQWWEALTGGANGQPLSNAVLTLESYYRTAQRFPKEVKQVEKLFSASEPSDKQLRASIGFQLLASAYKLEKTPLKLKPGEPDPRGSREAIRALLSGENVPISRAGYVTAPTVLPGRSVVLGDLEYVPFFRANEHIGCYVEICVPAPVAAAAADVDAEDRAREGDCDDDGGSEFTGNLCTLQPEPTVRVGRRGASSIDKALDGQPQRQVKWRPHLNVEGAAYPVQTVRGEIIYVEEEFRGAVKLRLHGNNNGTGGDGGGDGGGGDGGGGGGGSGFVTLQNPACRFSFEVPVKLRLYEPWQLHPLSRFLPAKDDKWGVEAVLCVTAKSAFEGTIADGRVSEYTDVSFKVSRAAPLRAPA